MATTGGSSPKGTQKRYSTAEAKEINVKISAYTKDAVKSIRDLERQIKLLTSIADRGANTQNGFLSRKQVMVYKEVMKEIEHSYRQHMDRLNRIQQEYSTRRSRLEKDLSRKEQDLFVAQGGNKWGNVATPKIISHKQKRVTEAKERLKEFEDLETNMSNLGSVKSRMEQGTNEAYSQSEKIGDLREANMGVRNQVRGALRTAGRFGAITSLHSLDNYLDNGKSRLRQEEYQAALMSQSITAYGGRDADFRTGMVGVGQKNQYDVYETQQTSRRLLLGGTNGNLSDLQSDTNTAQTFARGYGIDANDFASEASLMKKVGAVNEGQMQKFANLLAGSIAKTNMRGREEEMLRATASLVYQAGQKLAEVTPDQLGNIVGIQTALGDAVPTLKGQRGSELLSSMDSAIKEGGNAYDVLMGKGINPNYTGLTGSYNLEYQKEEGISNPKNVQDFFLGVDRSGASSEVKAFMAKNIGLSLHEEKTLRDSGLIEKFKKGEFGITDEEKQQLMDAGEQDLLDRIKDWNSTTTKDWLDNTSKDHAIQSSAAKPVDRMGKAIGQMWHGLPDWLQVGSIYGAGIGGGVLGTRFGGKVTSGMWDAITKMFTPTIKQTMGGGGTGFTSTMKSWASKGFSSGLDDVAEAIPKYSDDILGSVGATGGKLLGNIGKFSPLISFATSVGMDRLTNPQNTWGNSISKGAGSTAGGYAGIGLAPVLHSVGGLGMAVKGLVNPEKDWKKRLATGMGMSVTNSMGMAGSMIAGALGGSVIGEKWGDSIYKKFFGSKETKVSDEVGSNSSNEKIVVNNLDIQDKDFADFLQTKSTSGGNQATASAKVSYTPSYSADGTEVPKEHNVKISISGSIDGMTKENETDVKKSLVDYFGNIFGSKVNTNIDLSKNYTVK